MKLRSYLSLICVLAALSRFTRELQRLTSGLFTATSNLSPTQRLQARKRLFAVALLAAPMLASAGTGGTEFTVAYTTLTSWLQGDLGRLIAAALLVVGLIAGVIRQSIMAAVPAIACGLVATIAPTVISAVVTAEI